MSVSQASLRTLLRRFETAAGQHNSLYCSMVERPLQGDGASYGGFPNRKPNSLNPVAEACGAMIYTDPTFVSGVLRPGRTREWHMYGSSAGIEAFKTLGGEAGRWMSSVDALTLDGLAAETIAIRGDWERWLWTLFDFAWNPIQGSPLVARRMAWSGNVSIPIDEVAEWRCAGNPRPDDPIGLALALLPDPIDAFYSVIDDILGGSCYAVERIAECEATAIRESRDQSARAATARRSGGETTVTAEEQEPDSSDVGSSIPKPVSQNLGKTIGDHQDDDPSRSLPIELSVSNLAKMSGRSPTTIRKACDAAGVERADAGQGKDFSPHEVSLIARARMQSTRFSDDEKSKWDGLLCTLGQQTLDQPLKARAKK